MINNYILNIIYYNFNAPEAQLVEALGLYPIGCGFKSHGEHHSGIV